MAVHFHPLTIRAIRRETTDSVLVEFDVPEDLKAHFSFRHGQNLTLRKIINGEEFRRSYSICTGPHEEILRVAIKKAKGGIFSGFANEQLHAGDLLEVMSPTGSFYTSLDPDQKKQYLAFASGSGITPVMSILKSVLFTEAESEFTLVYGNKNRASIMFRDELEDIKNKYMSRFRLIHILSRETTDLPLFAGRINAEKCDALFRTLIQINNIDEFFICGPEEMIHSVAGFLKQNNIPEEKIHFELFTTPGSKRNQLSAAPATEKPALNKSSQVTIQLDGITSSFELNYSGDSILNAALNQGIDLPYACKGGVCSSCKAKLKEGFVEMDANYALEKDEIEKGFILTCQSHPRSQQVFVNFDER